MKIIYTITTIEQLEHPMKCRTVAWFEDKQVTIDVVKDNALDIHETNYEYCIVEETPEGIYPYPTKQTWFKWNKENERYEEIDTPKEMKNVVNFGIG